MENTETYTDQDGNKWQYIIGIKVYRRAIRREHNARSKKACPWCKSTNTLPYEEEGDRQEGPELVCLNCCYIFDAPTDSLQGATRHEV